MTSSSRPASANWPPRSPPPTIHTFFPPAAATISACTGATSPLHELDPRSGTAVSSPAREDPARQVVRPLPLRRVLVGELVLEDPLVRRRAHRERADPGDELVVVEGPSAVLVPREEPVERVVRVRDEAVERRRRVVLREAHSWRMPCFSSAAWTRASIWSPSYSMRAAMSSTAEPSPAVGRAELPLERAAHALLDARGELRAEILEPALDVALELVLRRLRGAGDGRQRRRVCLLRLEPVDRDLEHALGLVDPAQVPLRRAGRPRRRPGRPEPTSARVVSESRICPPRPSVQIRAARTTSRPT